MVFSTPTEELSPFRSIGTEGGALDPDAKPVGSKFLLLGKLIIEMLLCKNRLIVKSPFGGFRGLGPHPLIPLLAERDGALCIAKLFVLTHRPLYISRLRLTLGSITTMFEAKFYSTPFGGI